MKANKKMNLFTLLFSLSLTTGILFGYKLLLAQRVIPESGMLINGQRIVLEIADTPQKISQGLSGRESLKKNQGMLFIFNQPTRQPFWMSKMRFGLDFIFINGNQIVEVIENVPFPSPSEAPLTVNSKQDFDKVLEINQGVAKELNLKTGDQVQFSLKPQP